MEPTRLQIRIFDDPCLHQKSDMLDFIGASERILIGSMLKTMYEAQGVGLAAPQVGINKQLFVADSGEGLIVIANPKILKKKGSCRMEEGCLSFPGVAVDIRRPKTIEVEYLNQDNRIVKKKFSELMARIFLHEYDHLMGTVIVDYIDSKDKDVFEKQLSKTKGTNNQSKLSL